MGIEEGTPWTPSVTTISSDGRRAIYHSLPAVAVCFSPYDREKLGTWGHLHHWTCYACSAILVSLCGTWENSHF